MVKMVGQDLMMWNNFIINRQVRWGPEDVFIMMLGYDVVMM